MRCSHPAHCRAGEHRSSRCSPWCGSLARVPACKGSTRYMLRHSCRYDLADRGTDPRTMQDYLGHRDPQHTVHYSFRQPQERVGACFAGCRAAHFQQCWIPSAIWGAADAVSVCLPLPPLTRCRSNRQSMGLVTDAPRGLPAVRRGPALQRPEMHERLAACAERSEKPDERARQEARTRAALAPMFPKKSRPLPDRRASE